MDQPFDHVIRPTLPWRTDAGVFTECGRPAEQVQAAHLLERSDVIAKVKKQGQQRAAMSTCMTCWHTTSTHRTWDASPTEVMARETKRSAWYGLRPGPETQLDRELRAIEALINAHRHEFDEYLDGLAATVNLRERRIRRDRR